MKKIIISLLFLVSASLYAMNQNDLRIVPFDPAKHSHAIDLFRSLIDIEPLISNPPTITVSVLVKPRSKRPDTILGAIAYQTTDSQTKIEAVSVAREHRSKGYGTLLMKHIEESIQTSKEHQLYLQPINGKTSFYEQLGYAYEDTEIPFYMRKTIRKDQA